MPKKKKFWQSKTFWAGALLMVGAVGLYLNGEHEKAYALFLQGAGLVGIRDALGLDWKA